MSRTDAGLRDAVGRKGSFGQTLKAIGWAFFGVRKSSEHEKDVGRLNPVHVIVGGVIAAAVFVFALVLLVQWVLGSGIAA
jgi:hypothetical protein